MLGSYAKNFICVNEPHLLLHNRKKVASISLNFEHICRLGLKWIELKPELKLNSSGPTFAVGAHR